MNHIETIRLSEKAKTQLITMKRRTGIANWNVLCRWAFCLSIKEETRPPEEEIPSDSSIEMSWKTFTGGAEEVYWAMLVVRAEEDAIDFRKEALAHYFRLHLHRGISYLTGLNGPADLAQLIRLALIKV
jgi:DNA sulfur modification protein DndE